MGQNLVGRGFAGGFRARIRDLDYVKGACERWARWCTGARPQGVSMTGRLMQGVRANVCPGWIADVQAGRAHDPYCPQCQGKGRLPIALTATRRAATRTCPVCEGAGQMGRADALAAAPGTCHRCRGAGRVTVVQLRVNPAGIRATRAVGGAPTGDWQSLLVDDLVTSWRERDGTFWLNRVLVREYFYNGTQAMKAEQLRVSRSFYEKTLRAAYGEIDQALHGVGGKKNV